MSKLINLQGQKFGRLTTLSLIPKHDPKQLKTLWECVCDCGKRKIVDGQHLRNGHTKSCGCFQKEIVAKISSSRLKIKKGLRFNKLIVLKRIENDQHGNSLWLCKCDCQQTTTVKSSNLLSGNTKSCGCYRKTLVSRYKNEEFQCI